MAQAAGPAPPSLRQAHSSRSAAAPASQAAPAPVPAAGAQNPATSVSVDAAANQHAINPNIYGVGAFTDSDNNVLTSDLAAVNAPIHRYGGDLSSTYNWQQDAWNLDHDWYWESYLLSSPQTEGAFADSFISGTRAANVGTEPAITIPMLPYIAKVGPDANTGAASLWSYSIAKYGAQTGADPWQADAGNGTGSATGKPILTNNPTDANVANSVTIQQAWLQHLLSRWGASTTATGVKYYILDNEPSIWSSSHQDVHPAAETYQELYDDIVAYAGAIRAADPKAKIIGPEEWSWWAMWESGYDQANGTGGGSDYATHNNTYYYPWLLQQLYKYEQTTGTRLIDILTVHCYNTVPGGGDDATSQQQRNRQTRILWDPAFANTADWQTSSGLNNEIEEYIPLMKSWVNQYYPGLAIGCTEYDWGDDNELNGATAQADVLGIYGAYGFDLATIWGVPAYPTFLAFEIYRNYDGRLSTFGNTSVSATVANPDNLSAFAALRSSDGALTVMVINKQQGSTPVSISLANFSSAGTAQAYQISSATQTSIDSLGSVAIANNTIGTTVPSQSITLFVVPAGTATSVPTAPTGLAATVGNGTVTLTWNAGGGATSYNVQRGSSSGGPFTSVGTVTSPAPTTLTDTNLTNGTTYYYVVSGTDKAGTGPASAPLAATPINPPTFSSSATASPNPVTQNSSTTITATVKCTANTLTNGTVTIVVLDPSGNVALTKSATAQTFAANQSQTYTAPLTPALTGTYTVEVGVYSATGQQWSFNSSAAGITVNSALSWTSSAAPVPSSIAASGSSVVSFTVKDTGTVGLSNANVEIQVFNSSGTACGDQEYSGQNFTAGQTQSYSFTWTPSSLSPPVTANGTYTVEIGVFDSTWTTDYYWNGSAATIAIANGTATPAFTSTATATPTSVAVGAASSISASVQDTGGPLSAANVLINVYPAGSTTAVGSQTFSSQNLTAGGTVKYTSSWTPAAGTAAGTYTVAIGVFDSTWNTDYYWNGNAATITVNAAAPQSQTIAFNNPGAQTVGTPLTLTATASSGLAVSFAATTGGVCTVANTTATFLAAGTCTIQASQAGNGTYAAATAVSRSFTVSAKTSGPLTIATKTCPGGTQGAAYAGCTIAATGGTAPYTFSLETTSGNHPPLPEGLALNPTTGAITSSQIGGQGAYTPEIVVTDSTGSKATADIAFAINGSNAFAANIFPAGSILHHRVDAATTGLPVDTSPAGPMYSGYLPESIRVFFGNTSNAPFPNGIPMFEVPYNQPDVAVATTVYQSYYTSGPIPANAPPEGTSASIPSGGDMHVLIYREAGGGNPPALYEMWQGIYEGGPWTCSSNALWSNVGSTAMTPQGNGTTDAAGLPIAPLVVNADEVIGTGTPAAPNGAVEHPIRFTLNHMLNYWVWPATETAGVGSCKAAGGSSIPVESEISQATPPASCTMSGAAGEIYRLKASVGTPACAGTSPQAAIIIAGFRNYGIILADNGMSGGLIGTPDARWNDGDLSCLTSIKLGDFEPVNVSSLMVSDDSFGTQGSQPPQSQTIAFNNPGTQVIGTPLTLVATSSSGLPVSFASETAGVCAVSGTKATFLAAGTCTIQATQAGNGSYLAATPVIQSFQVTQAGQTIAFGALANRSLGTAPFTVGATASSGLPVSFNSQTTSVCTVSGSLVTLAAAGTCTIQATQPGNGTYLAATPVNRSFTVTAAVTQPTISGAISAGAFGAFSTVAPGTWVEVYGSNLAAGTHTWTSADFNGNNAPTSLGGVQVSIGGQSAFIDYVSPGQVNAQLPSNIDAGSWQLTVTSGSVTSAAVNVTVNATEPGLLAPPSFNVGGNQYVVAQFGDGTYVLPAGAVSGVNSRPAKPGETIVIYGIGFGPVVPNTPAGEIAPASTRLSESLQFLFSQTPAPGIPYAGLAPGYVGLYQFDLVVPQVPDSGLVPLTFTLGGTPGTQTLYTAVHQ
jgi:uncharacterized protein (TIGR03437 family)